MIVVLALMVLVSDRARLVVVVTATELGVMLADTLKIYGLFDYCWSDDGLLECRFWWCLWW